MNALTINENIPVVVRNIIFNKLGPKDQGKASCVCESWLHEISQSNPALEQFRGIQKVVQLGVCPSKEISVGENPTFSGCTNTGLVFVSSRWNTYLFRQLQQIEKIESKNKYFGRVGLFHIFSCSEVKQGHFLHVWHPVKKIQEISLQHLIAPQERANRRDYHCTRFVTCSDTEFCVEVACGKVVHLILKEDTFVLGKNHEKREPAPPKWQIEKQYEELTIKNKSQEVRLKTESENAHCLVDDLFYEVVGKDLVIHYLPTEECHYKVELTPLLKKDEQVISLQANAGRDIYLLASSEDKKTTRLIHIPWASFLRSPAN